MADIVKDPIVKISIPDGNRQRSAWQGKNFEYEPLVNKPAGHVYTETVSALNKKTTLPKRLEKNRPTIPTYYKYGHKVRYKATTSSVEIEVKYFDPYDGKLLWWGTERYDTGIFIIRPPGTYISVSNPGDEAYDMDKEDGDS